jgi:hypothetical protein
MVWKELRFGIAEKMEENPKPQILVGTEEER